MMSGFKTKLSELKEGLLTAVGALVIIGCTAYMIAAAILLTPLVIASLLLIVPVLFVLTLLQHVKLPQLRLRRQKSNVRATDVLVYRRRVYNYQHFGME